MHIQSILVSHTIGCRWSSYTDHAPLDDRGCEGASPSQTFTESNRLIESLLRDCQAEAKLAWLNAFRSMHLPAKGMPRRRTRYYRRYRELLPALSDRKLYRLENGYFQTFEVVWPMCSVRCQVEACFPKRIWPNEITIHGIQCRNKYAVTRTLSTSASQTPSLR